MPKKYVQQNRGIKQGHEVRWAKGADLLADRLSIIEIVPEWFSNNFYLGKEYVNLLNELNLGIANYTLHKWKELLINRANSPIISTEAYNWDKVFIYEEQGQIAPPIYSKYEQNYPNAIDKMNGIVHQQPSDNGLETLFNLIVGQMSGIPEFDDSVPCIDIQYRVDSSQVF